METLNANLTTPHTPLPMHYTGASSSLQAILRMCNRRRLLRFTWILSSSGMLSSVGWFRTDVSRLRISPVLKDQDVQEEGTSWPLKMEPICSPETSVRNQHPRRQQNSTFRMLISCRHPCVLSIGSSVCQDGLIFTAVVTVLVGIA